MNKRFLFGESKKVLIPKISLPKMTVEELLKNGDISIYVYEEKDRIGIFLERWDNKKKIKLEKYYSKYLPSFLETVGEFLNFVLEDARAEGFFDEGGK